MKLPAALVMLGAVFVAAIMAFPAAPVTQGTQCITYEDENFEAELNEYLAPYGYRTERKAPLAGAADNAVEVQGRTVAVTLDGTVIGTFNVSDRTYVPVKRDASEISADYELIVQGLPAYEGGKVILVGQQFRLELRDSLAMSLPAADDIVEKTIVEAGTFSSNNNLFKAIIGTSALKSSASDAEERILQTEMSGCNLLFAYDGEIVYVAEGYGHYKLDPRSMDVILPTGMSTEVLHEDIDFLTFFCWTADNNDIISGLLEEYDGIAFHGTVVIY